MQLRTVYKQEWRFLQDRHDSWDAIKVQVDTEHNLTVSSLITLGASSENRPAGNCRMVSDKRRTLALDASSANQHTGDCRAVAG